MSIRRGIPYLYSTKTKKGNWTPSLNTEEYNNLMDSEGRVWINNITEKTDGQVFLVGFDKEGFYSQNSGSGIQKMRNGQDYIARSRERGTKLEIATAFAEFHDRLLENTSFIRWMSNQKDRIIKGEVFLNRLTRPSHIKNEVIYSHISYDPINVGPLGSFIIHSRLEENSWIEHYWYLKSELSNKFIYFDTDEPKSRLNAHYVEWNKDPEVLENSIVSYLDSCSYVPKWGSESEGYVIHPSHRNPIMPRFKIITDTFKRNKANGW